MQEYKDYLIELSDYKSEKKGEKFKKRMQTLGSVLGVMSSFAMSTATGFLSEGAQAGWKKLKGWFASNKGTVGDYIKRSGLSADASRFGVEFQAGTAMAANQGGKIPTMLTAGEGIIPSSIAGSMGYDNLDYMNNTGNIPIIQGPGGIDNVGPVGLSPGDFVMSRNSTEKLMSGNSNNVPSTAGATQVGGRTGAQMSETTNNININVAIDQSGTEVASGDGDGEASYNKEKELSSKIKNAVIEVIRQEKRIGGELS